MLIRRERSMSLAASRSPPVTISRRLHISLSPMSSRSNSYPRPLSRLPCFKLFEVVLSPRELWCDEDRGMQGGRNKTAGGVCFCSGMCAGAGNCHPVHPTMCRSHFNPPGSESTSKPPFSDSKRCERYTVSMNKSRSRIKFLPFLAPIPSKS